MSTPCEKPQMDPARHIIEKMGGLDVVQKVTGLSRVQVWRWTQSKAEWGTNGLVPVKYYLELQKYSDEHGLGLTWDDMKPRRENFAAARIVTSMESQAAA